MNERELRLATLARQLLLEPSDLPVADAVERVAGLQAQESTGPYLGLRSRLADFRADELTSAIDRRELLVATLHRVTLHLVTANDHRWVQPTLAPVHEKTRRFPTIRGLDQEALLAEARRRAPVRMPALHRLAPGAEKGHLSGFFQACLPFVRVPPAGTWGVGGSPLQELVEVGEPDPKRLVLSYLRAFGPATAKDAQAWSGLTRLASIFAELELEELGGGLYDVPGAPRPPADAEAPPRFLPRWDNVLVGFADRSRFGTYSVGDACVLVDGLAVATWRWTGDDVEVTPRVPEAEDERVRLRDWLAAQPR